MTYDDLGRVLTETIHQPGVKEHVLTRLYNDGGRSSGFEWQKGEDDIQVVYGYDTSGRMRSVTDGELEVTYEYLVNTGLIEHAAYLNHRQETMRTTKTYDRLQRLLDTTTRRVSDGDVLSSHGYRYNQANQRTSSLDEQGTRWNYDYDSLGQVISGEQIHSDEGSVQRHTYDYDSIGNRQQAITQRSPRSQSTEESYQPNLLNQYEGRKTMDAGTVAVL